MVTYYKEKVNFEYIKEFLVGKKYSAIVDFLYYKEVEEYEKIVLPIDVKNITAGIDWAGNTGRLIGKLLLNEKAIGEDFTVSSGQNISWGELADIYIDVFGIEIEWVSMDDFIKYGPDLSVNKWGLKYDRVFDRFVDVSKILSVTGMKKEDFKTIKEALAYEIKKVKGEF